MTELWYKRTKAVELPSQPKLAKVAPMFYDAKLDGWMVDVGRAPNGYPFALSRTKSVLDKLRNCAWINQLVADLSPGAAIEGELYCPGLPASEVSHLLCTEPNKLVFCAFAVPSMGGSPSDELSRLDLADVERMLRGLGLQVPPRRP